MGEKAEKKKARKAAKEAAADARAAAFAAEQSGPEPDPEPAPEPVSEEVHEPGPALEADAVLPPAAEVHTAPPSVTPVEPLVPPLEDLPQPPTSLVRSVLDRIGNSRLSYGEPVRNGEVVIVPVSRIRSAGGGGFGRNDADTGGGGGGFIESHPVGYIEITAGGAHFVSIPDPEARARMIRNVGGLLVALVGALVRLRMGRAPERRRLRRGS